MSLNFTRFVSAHQDTCDFHGIFRCIPSRDLLKCQWLSEGELLLQSFYVFGFHERHGYSYINISNYRSLPYVHRIYKHHKNRRMKTHEFQAFFRVIFKTAPKRDMHRKSCLFSHQKNCAPPNPWIIKSNLDTESDGEQKSLRTEISTVDRTTLRSFALLHFQKSIQMLLLNGPEKPLLTCRPLARCNSARGTSKIQCESLFCCMWKRARAAHFERIILSQPIEKYNDSALNIRKSDWTLQISQIFPCLHLEFPSGNKLLRHKCNRMERSFVRMLRVEGPLRYGKLRASNGMVAIFAQVLWQSSPSTNYCPPLSEKVSEVLCLGKKQKVR